jgi:hypothetical protein
MESLDAHKISNRESVNSSVVNSSINFFNSDLNEENPKPFDSTKFLKIEKDEMNKSTNIIFKIKFQLNYFDFFRPK